MDSQLSKNIGNKVFVSPGMPELEMHGRQLSFFEFWPTWLIYFPVFVQVLVMALLRGSITLPLLANPRIHLGGMVGVPKSSLLEQAGSLANQVILTWFIYEVNESTVSNQADQIEKNMASHALKYPLVCKPDIGCRGSGVKLVRDRATLEQCITRYPAGSKLMIQRLSDWEPEAGLFYVRYPGQESGRIISLGLKYMPYVLGDGGHTLEELIAMDPRARLKQELYLSRHKASLKKVLPEGEPYRLVFSASHCRGAVFRNGQQFITPVLSDRIDQLMKDIPEFYYGRLDIKFRDIESLSAGEDIQIVEINAASSESLHIWDRNTSYFDALRTLFWQYKTLFEIGAENFRRGYKVPGIRALWHGWRLEKKLSKHHPVTD